MPRPAHLFALVSLGGAALTGCRAETDWAVVVEGTPSQVSLFVREGSCDGADRWRGDGDAAAGLDGAPPALEDGVYGVGGFAFDEACRLLACGCQEVAVPLEAEVETTLEAVSDAAACPSPPSPPPCGGACGWSDGCGFHDDARCPPGQFLGREGACLDRVSPSWASTPAPCPAAPVEERDLTDCGLALSDIGAAMRGLADRGGVIHLGACTYVDDSPEDLPLPWNATPPAWVELRGAGPDQTILRVDGCASPPCRPVLRLLGGGGLALRGLTLEARAEGQDAVAIADARDGTPSANVLLEDVSIVASRIGVAIGDSTDVTLRRVNVRAGDHAIRIAGGDTRAARIAVLGARLGADAGSGAAALRIVNASDVELTDLEIEGWPGRWATVEGAREVFVTGAEVTADGGASFGECPGCGPGRVRVQGSRFTTPAPAFDLAARGTLELFDNALEGVAGSQLVTDGPGEVRACGPLTVAGPGPVTRLDACPGPCASSTSE